MQSDIFICYKFGLCLPARNKTENPVFVDLLTAEFVNAYNSVYMEPLPKITPHICRHTYCSIMAKSGMNPKTLQYLMGHSEIGVTMDTYTHLTFEDAKDEVEQLEKKK